MILIQYLKKMFSKTETIEPWYKGTIYEIDNYEMCKNCELKLKCQECASDMLKKVVNNEF